MRSPERASVARRVRVAAWALGLVFVVLAGRAAQLTLMDRRGADQGEDQIVAVRRMTAARGSILDRNRRPLALSVPAPSVYAAPLQVADARAAARALAGVLEVPAARLEARLSRRSAFVYLARWVDQERAEAVRALGLAGVGVVEEPRRAYPLGSVAGPVLGFSNIDGTGVRGIEQQEDGWLRGRAQRLAAERDAHRRLLIQNGADPRRAAGGEITLTLDAAFQGDAERLLAEAVEATGALGGSVVSLDPRSGEILALAERPGFDPNDFRRVPYRETRSRTLLDAVEPGSTLKPVLVASALEAGVLDASEVIDCEEGILRVGGRSVRDLHPEDRLDVTGVLRESSNVAAAKIGFRLGAEAHHAALRRFGFGSPTGSGFPEESAGLLRPAKRWRPIDHANVAFGQGLGVTPLQMAAAFAALADEGRLRTPRLVSERRTADGDWQPVVAAAPRAAVAPEVARTVLAMLEEAAGPEGTGRRAALRGVRVAGKTGTAQKLDPGTGAYSTERYLAWFAGVVPADDPRLAIVVVIDEPQGGVHTGGAVAAPVFARVAAAQLARLGIATAPTLPPLRPVRVAEAAEPPARPEPAASPEPERTAQAQPAPNAKPDPRARPSAEAPAPPAPERVEPPAPEPVDRSVEIVRLGDRLLLPDFRGLRPAEVARITREHALEVEMVGRGRAVAQQPAPGSVVAVGGGPLQLRFEGGGDEG